MSQILKSLREKRGSADTHKTPPTLVEKWRMEVGQIRLWIIGPGGDAMHPASDTYYSGRIGTDEERQIAQRAVRLLDRTHRDHEAGPTEIQAALDQAAHQIKHGLPMPSAIVEEPQPFLRPAPEPIRIITQEDAKRILAAVEFETGIAASTFMDVRSPKGRLSPKHIRNRALSYGIAKALFPKNKGDQIAAAFGTVHGTVCQGITRNQSICLADPKYKIRFEAIVSKLS